MKELDQQIAIAEWCGYSVIIQAKDGGLVCGILNNKPFQHIPDYLHDLNAMHEAELLLGAQIGIYRVGLQQVCKRTNQGTAEATASQRAEALLRTIGKWKDE